MKKNLKVGLLAWPWLALLLWALVPTGAQAASIVSTSGAPGMALCPFAVKNAAGATQGTIDCSGQETVATGYAIDGGAGVFYSQIAKDQYGRLGLSVGATAAPIEGIAIDNNGNVTAAGVVASPYGFANGNGTFRFVDTGTGRLASNAAAGSDGFAATVNGERFHFGSGTTDYATSDGTTVTFAGPLATSGNFSATGYAAVGQIFAIGSTALNVRGQAADGATAIGVTIGNSVALANPTAEIAEFQNNGVKKGAVLYNGAGSFFGSDFQSQKLTSVAAGVAATDAANVGQVGYSSSPRTTVVNPALSVSAASCNAYGLTLTGAVVGAECVVGSGGVALGNLAVDCYVSAANTVQIHACNPTAGAISLPAATYSVRAWNP